MRIIIAGGRDFLDYKLLKERCFDIIRGLTSKEDILNNQSLFEIICGKAKGADTLGEQFGKEYKLPIKYFPADWDTFGKSAGYKRNEQMALYAKENNGVLIAFWDNKSKGTKHMIDLAKKHNLKVFIVNY